jgi:hypothetical protein
MPFRLIPIAGRYRGPAGSGDSHEKLGCWNRVRKSGPRSGEVPYIIDEKKEMTDGKIERLSDRKEPDHILCR